MKKLLLLSLFSLLMSCPMLARAACTISPTSATASLGTVTSFVLNTTASTTSTTITLQCGSGLVVLLSSDHITVTLASASPSASGRANLGDGASDLIPIQLCSTSNCSTELTIGGTGVTYTQSELVNLAGLLGSFNFPLTFYIRTIPGVVVPAGTYTSTLSMVFNYAICTSVSVLGVCLLGNEQTGSFTVPVTVNMVVTNDCTTITAPAINFGSAPLVSSFSGVSQSINVICTKGSAYTVGMNAGLHATGTQRYMANGSNLLAYQIYQGTSGTTLWADTGTARVASSAASAVSSDGLTKTFNYNALILTGQNTPAQGTYTDTVTIDLSF